MTKKYKYATYVWNEEQAIRDYLSHETSVMRSQVQCIEEGGFWVVWS